MPLDGGAREESALWLRLALTPGVSPAVAQSLLRFLGPPDRIFDAGLQRLTQAAGQRIAAALLGADEQRERRIADALEWAAADPHHLVTLADPRYPQPLLQIGDPPTLLFVAGDATTMNRPALAIVGSRHATRSGGDHAESFAHVLGKAGVLVVSGLALGIDAAAHRGGLDTRGGTLAVVGTGLDIVYPAQNRALARRIAARGTVVSELPLGAPPLRHHFPRRNRLIAGMVQGVLVVEAALQSGSLITARQAADYGREVFAIPGSIDAPLARGCHSLLKNGAKLVESAHDILSERPYQALAPVVTAAAGAAGTARRGQRGHTTPELPGLSGTGDPLLEAAGWDPVSLDELAERTGRPAGDLASALLELELRGDLERLVDGRVVRRRAA